jgi:hypothetical protein
VEQSPSWEANSNSSSYIPCLLWKWKVYCRVHKNPPLVPILSQLNPVGVFASCYLTSIIMNLGLSLPSGRFPSGFPNKILHLAPVGATIPTHLILIDTNRGNRGKNWSTWIYNEYLLVVFPHVIPVRLMQTVSRIKLIMCILVHLILSHSLCVAVQANLANSIYSRVTKWRAHLQLHHSLSLQWQCSVNCKPADCWVECGVRWGGRGMTHS